VDAAASKKFGGCREEEECQMREGDVNPLCGGSRIEFRIENWCLPYGGGVTSKLKSLTKI
jgi:hypothetical protein